MLKKRMSPRVLRVEETHVGRVLASDPKAQERHDSIVKILRDAAKEEIELLRRSETLGRDDFSVVINTLAD